MKFKMEKVQGPISKPKVAHAQVDKQEDLTGGGKVMKPTHSTPKQITMSVKTNIPIGILTIVKVQIVYLSWLYLLATCLECNSGSSPVVEQ